MINEMSNIMSTLTTLEDLPREPAHIFLKMVSIRYVCTKILGNNISQGSSSSLVRN